MTFEKWRHDCGIATRFFSLGRHALAEALRLAGVRSGDKVLLPEFICRDVLASLHAVGALAIWYPIAENLRPATDQKQWPDAKAVLAVNYFGFPQSLDIFRAYAARTGAILIEDNAHGFLSRDEEARWLGTRAALGIFSLRKTLPLADGAMLACSDLTKSLPAPLEEVGSGFSSSVALKAKLRRVLGRRLTALLTETIRKVRGVPDDAGSAADEQVMPYAPAPHIGLNGELGRLDVDAEILRRRDAYLEAETTAKAAGVAPLFPSLSTNVSPYGFAFRPGRANDVNTMNDWARRRGFDLISWPALPTEVAAHAPVFYRNVHLVNFL